MCRAQGIKRFAQIGLPRISLCPVVHLLIWTKICVGPWERKVAQVAGQTKKNMQRQQIGQGSQGRGSCAASAHCAALATWPPQFWAVQTVLHRPSFGLRPRPLVHPLPFPIPAKCLSTAMGATRQELFALCTNVRKQDHRLGRVVGVELLRAPAVSWLRGEEVANGWWR